MIRLNVDEQALENGIGLIDTVKEIFWYQIFWRDSLGKDIRLKAIQLDKYENNEKPPFIYDGLKKKRFLTTGYNLLKPLCDTATQTFIGRVPDITTIGGEYEKHRIGVFSNLLKKHDFEEEITDGALKQSITGSGFVCEYAKEGDVFPRFRSLSPKYTNVVYDCSIAMKPLFAYHIYFDASSSGGISGKYVCLIYTKKKMFAFYTTQMSIPTKMAFDVYPLSLFLINGAQYSFEMEHGFSDIPIVELFNNKDCISDCKSVLGLIDLYSELQNNRFQNVDDIINYLLVIKNSRLGDEDEIKAAIDLIKGERVLPLEGEDTDAKFLANPLNQTDIQKLSDDYKNLIHYITHIPDLTSNEFFQNASDPIIKAKTKPLLDLCLQKEKWFNKGYIKLLELALNFVKDNDKKLYEKVKFDINNIDLVYTHTLPSNDIDNINAIVNLANAGLANPEVLLQGVTLIPNVDSYLQGMYKYNEYVDKRKLMLKNENKDNGGVNETNIERQNSKAQTKDQEDNMKNATNGQSKNISDNKVE